jgi:hypothetical protein
VSTQLQLNIYHIIIFIKRPSAMSGTAALNGSGLSATHMYPARCIPNKRTIFGIVDIAIRLWAGQAMNYASFPGRRERIISFPDIQIGTEAHPPIQWLWGWGLSLGVKGTGRLTVHLHLVLKLRMHGAVSYCPHVLMAQGRISFLSKRQL